MNIQHSPEWLDGYRAALETVRLFEEKASKDFQRIAEEETGNREIAKAKAESHRVAMETIDIFLAMNRAETLVAKGQGAIE